MNKANKGFLTFCIPLLILFFISSCEDPGSVGSDYADSPTLTFDTLSVSETKKLSYVGYSGLLTFIPLGEFSDPLFGDISTIGLFKPIRTPSLPDSIRVGQSFDMKLKLALDSLQTYGDTLSESMFSVYEVSSDWRGTNMKFDTEVEYGDLVGTFNIGNEDDIIVDLSEQWKNKYRSYYFDEDDDADSTYNYEFQGLAVVSNQQNHKISFTTASSSEFLMVFGADSDTGNIDTVSVPLADWGYTMAREGTQSFPESTFPVYSTLEGMLELTFPDSLLRAQNRNKNIIQADLLVYEVQDENNTSLTTEHSVRLSVNSIKVNPEEVSDPVYEYQFSNNYFVGTRSEDDHSFQIGITNYVNNLIYTDDEAQKLIIGIGSPTGALRSTLLYDETAPEQYRPKIIITSLEN